MYTLELSLISSPKFLFSYCCIKFCLLNASNFIFDKEKFIRHNDTHTQTKRKKIITWYKPEQRKKYQEKKSFKKRIFKIFHLIKRKTIRKLIFFARVIPLQIEIRIFWETMKANKPFEVSEKKRETNL